MGQKNENEMGTTKKKGGLLDRVIAALLVFNLLSLLWLAWVAYDGTEMIVGLHLVAFLLLTIGIILPILILIFADRITGRMRSLLFLANVLNMSLPASFVIYQYFDNGKLLTESAVSFLIIIVNLVSIFIPRANKAILRLVALSTIILLCIFVLSLLG